MLKLGEKKGDCTNIRKKVAAIRGYGKRTTRARTSSRGESVVCLEGDDEKRCRKEGEKGDCRCRTKCHGWSLSSGETCKIPGGERESKRAHVENYGVAIREKCAGERGMAGRAKKRRESSNYHIRGELTTLFSEKRRDEGGKDSSWRKRR